MSTVEGTLKHIKNLPGSKGKSEAELLKEAEEIEKLNALGVQDMFADKEEKKEAKVLLRKYLDDWTPETVSDLNTLKQLIYFEIVQFRLQETLNDIHSKNQAVPLQLLESLQKNIETVTMLKDKLGVSRETRLQNKEDAFKALETLKKKFRVWSQENQASRNFACGYCGQMNLLRVRPDVWEAQKHPFFKDRILGNKHLIRLFKEGKLSKEDLVLVLECSPDYIDWLIKKWEQV